MASDFEWKQKNGLWPNVGFYTERGESLGGRRNFAHANLAKGVTHPEANGGARGKCSPPP
jgi:hypothetical protein